MMDEFNNGIDGNLAYRMKRVNSEQFYTLVRMHLSFELELNSEENDLVTEKAKLKKWGLLHFSKKPKPILNPSKCTEGVILTKEGLSQLKQLIAYLTQDKCIQEEGIFRRTGKITRQNELKSALQQKKTLNFEAGKYSVHDCASVLKNFLADLSEPLLTDQYYPAYYQIASELCTSSNQDIDGRLLRSLQLLFLLLPSLNRIVLKQVLCLLNKTAKMECSNKMNCNTLATLFTPHLLCPRKLPPEALHTTSQNLSGLVSFMISKGNELFEIPPKLMTDIKAFCVEQEKKLLSPQQPDPNESSSDMRDTARTVFSFVDHKLTAKATASQDTQAALAQLYAHIQSMPESAKKRRLVKQFNKENGQGTPRQTKNICKTKSLGDSIKKHIFQKKVLNNKKIIDVKCNFSRSSSEENILSTVLSRSDDELNTDNCRAFEKSNILSLKKLSNSTGSLHEPSSFIYNQNLALQNLRVEENYINNSSESPASTDDSFDNRLTRQTSRPLTSLTSQVFIKDERDENWKKETSDSEWMTRSRENDGLIYETENLNNQDDYFLGATQKMNDKGQLIMSPMPQYKLKSQRDMHTSTPSHLLRKSLGLYDFLTPILDDENNTSPITQSATKMSRAMQETMMTPRSRKPVVMSSSNSCNLSSSMSHQCNSSDSLQNEHFEPVIQENSLNALEIFKKSPLKFVMDTIQDLENTENVKEVQKEHQSIKSSDFQCQDQIKLRNVGLTAFSEYRLSKSVLTASPVDLSFISRTGEIENHDTDKNINKIGQVTEELNIDLANSDSYYNLSSNFGDENVIQRKRCTSLHRDDWKRSVRNDLEYHSSHINPHFQQDNLGAGLLLNSQNDSDLPETSF